MTSLALRSSVVVFVLLCVLGPAPVPAGPPPVSFGRDQVTVVDDRASHRLDVELAVTPEQRERGLMFRDSLAPDSGMLFLFEDERVVSMWMKNTRLALDLLFLGADGRILKVAEGARPFSLEVISSDLPARGVLELAAGRARALGLKPGDRVVHRAFARTR